MALRFSRRKLVLLSAMLIAAIGIAALLPLIASTQIVRDRIAAEMSNWSGYAVEVGKGPEIDVWPRFRATLHDVHFKDETGATVVWSDRVEVTISALSVLRGRLYYSRARFIRPILTVETSERFGILPRLPSGGKIRTAIEQAAGSLTSAGTSANLSDDELGVIEVSEGRVTTADTVIATELEAALDWPALDQAATLAAQMSWRGQPVSVTLSSAQPLVHLAGGGGELDLAIAAPQLNLSYAGAIGSQGDAVVDGMFQVTGPSLRQAVAWVRPDMSPGLAESAFELSSRVGGTVRDLRFENALMRFGQTAGLGGFELLRGGEDESLTGSMAFDQLHLPDTRSLYRLIDGSEGNPLTAEVNALDLDIRISATEATIGSIALSDLAATAQATEAQTLLDISDARLFDGTLQGSLRKDGATGTIDMRADLRDFDGSAAASAFGLSGLGLATRGDLALAVTAQELTAQDKGTALPHQLSGTAKLSLGTGTLTMPPIAEVGAMLEADGFFALRDLATAAQSFQTASAEVTINEGRSELRAGLTTEAEQIALSGLIAPSGGLALFGSLNETNPPQQTRPFFVGGTWAAPIISRTLPPAGVTP